MGSLRFQDSSFEAQFRQFMTQSGDGFGPINANGNYSASETSFFVQPSEDFVYLVGAVFIAISDNAKFLQDGYGAIPNGVTNGVHGFIKQRGIRVDAFAGNAFKQNVDWFGVGSEIIISTFDQNPQTLSVKFDTFGDTGGYILLDGRTGDQIGLTFNDDFSSLIRQTGVVRGIRLFRPWLIT